MMGYFSNATEGEIYEEQYCSKCVHYYASEDIDPCAIMAAHFFHQQDVGPRKVLDMLIPRDYVAVEPAGSFQNGPWKLLYQGAYETTSNTTA